MKRKFHVRFGERSGETRRLQGRKVRPAPTLRSGSFLIGAYQYLLDWHRDWYIANDPEQWAKKRNPPIYQAPTHRTSISNPQSPISNLQSPTWKLTTDERKRILLDTIHGVDIDPQAVEVTKLSLLLKVLEGESEETLGRQLSMFGEERVLPDLGHNIKCGNSLIGPDFYTAHPTQMSFFDQDEMYRINAFDWQAEFPQIMQAGGFDAVIGNPPYIRIQAMKEWAPLEVEFYKEAYVSASKGNYDIYVVFVEKGLSLLNDKGRLGFILPHKFFNAKYGEPLRGILAEGQHLSEVIHFGDQQVFENATTYTCLLFLDKQASDRFRFVQAHDLLAWQQNEPQVEGKVSADKVTADEWNFVVGPGADLFDRLSEMPVKLGDVADRMAQGIRTSANDVYVLNLVSEDGNLVKAKSKQLDQTVQLERDLLSMFLKGREVKSYRILYSGEVVIIPYYVQGERVVLIPEDELKRSFPLTYSYLKENKPFLEGRERGRMKGSNWYAYVYPKNIEIMASPKILVPDIADRAAYAYDATGEYALTSGYGITLKDSTSESPVYILGLLNSKVLDFYLKKVSTTLRGGFFRYFTQYIEQLPIHPIDFTNPTDKAHHDQMVALVERMLSLHEQVAQAQVPHLKTTLQRQIEATDRQIDRLVYTLYGLTEDEIRIVEGEAAQ